MLREDCGGIRFSRASIHNADHAIGIMQKCYGRSRNKLWIVDRGIWQVFLGLLLRCPCAEDHR